MLWGKVNCWGAWCAPWAQGGRGQGQEEDCRLPKALGVMAQREELWGVPETWPVQVLSCGHVESWELGLGHAGHTRDPVEGSSCSKEAP